MGILIKDERNSLKKLSIIVVVAVMFVGEGKKEKSAEAILGKMSCAANADDRRQGRSSE